jgi:hypothetical protein
MGERSGLFFLVWLEMNGDFSRFYPGKNTHTFTFYYLLTKTRKKGKQNPLFFFVPPPLLAFYKSFGQARYSRTYSTLLLHFICCAQLVFFVLCLAFAGFRRSEKHTHTPLELSPGAPRNVESISDAADNCTAQQGPVYARRASFGALCQQSDAVIRKGGD